VDGFTLILAPVLKITLIAVVVCLAFLVLAHFARKSGLRSGTRKKTSVDFSPYTLRDSLFTANERVFLNILDQAIGSEYRIFGMVRIADVVVAKTNNRKKWGYLFNRINRKHFDYVLCNKTDLSIVAAIELNDSSHSRPDRQERDQFVEEVCRAALLPLIWVPVQQNYSAAQIREAIFNQLNVQLPVSEPKSPAHERWKPGYTQQAGWQSQPSQQSGHGYQPVFDNYKPKNRINNNCLYFTLKILFGITVTALAVSFALYKYEEAILIMQGIGKSPSTTITTRTAAIQNNNSYNDRLNTSPVISHQDKRSYDRAIRKEQLEREKNRLRDAVTTARKTCDFWKDHARKNPKDLGGKQYKTTACNRLNSLRQDYNQVTLKLVGYR
jgi:hypothetical protein